MIPAHLDRRTFLRWSALVPAVAAVPAALGGPAWAEETAFVDAYRTNLAANRTPETNAVVRILTGMQRLWRTGSTWDSGVVLDAAVLRANVRHCVAVTRARTAAEAERAFVYDRQHQSYAAIGGLGPLAGLYRSGAKAVTSITTAPEGTPPSKIDDAVPANAPAGSALGAGAHDSELGLVAQLVDTVRGPFASGNPSKYAYQYPRPWRLTADSRVVPTGGTDALGYPGYESEVIVAPQLLRQRNIGPVDDGGFPSGHTNAFHLACLALAYAVPERFQELVARAYDLSDTRIVAGMHSPADVIGGRITATALTAATLADPEHATLKAGAREQALKYFTAKTGTTADTLFARAHTGADEYGDRRANAAMVARRAAYGLPDRPARTAMRVPKGAEVLLETRLPYLDTAQRREVLRTTAFPAGNPLLDGPELWGRLNLFAAADGYGAFDAGVRVTMDAARGGFCANDSWRHDIGGNGGLVKAGTGTLTLTGRNRYRGGTRVEAGTLVAAAPDALGTGDVVLDGGALRVAGLRAGGYRQTGGTLSVTAGPAVLVRGEATLEHGVLEIRLTGSGPAHEADVLCARRLRGRFSAIRADRPGYRVVPRYTATGLSVRILREFS
ncbi:autotransporter-associated beta strand repeat-containing protein [Amycolatopsis sp. A133]|uniref:phosphatase PAP2 family protein n=1 Tax=Amycolatopsis sp. A133 TaxID=3064472 RepID=UPI0027FFFA50|nr:phosphatase PAP2 family protein [Amycolatopsis sp. A133]MDQ7802354.1 autotransporter-associated beta strand repeat-containing protein [Amycolatopsis sp. A133]